MFFDFPSVSITPPVPPVPVQLPSRPQPPRLPGFVPLSNPPLRQISRALDEWDLDPDDSVFLDQRTPLSEHSFRSSPRLRLSSPSQLHFPSSPLFERDKQEWHVARPRKHYEDTSPQDRYGSSPVSSEQRQFQQRFLDVDYEVDQVAPPQHSCREEHLSFGVVDSYPSVEPEDHPPPVPPLEPFIPPFQYHKFPSLRAQTLGGDQRPVRRDQYPSMLLHPNQHGSLGDDRPPLPYDYIPAHHEFPRHLPPPPPRHDFSPTSQSPRQDDFHDRYRDGGGVRKGYQENEYGERRDKRGPEHEAEKYSGGGYSNFDRIDGYSNRRSSSRSRERGRSGNGRNSQRSEGNNGSSRGRELNSGSRPPSSSHSREGGGRRNGSGHRRDNPGEESSQSIHRHGSVRNGPNRIDEHRRTPTVNAAAKRAEPSRWGMRQFDLPRNDIESRRLPYHEEFEQCELVLEEPIIIEKDLDEVCASRDEPVSLVKLEPIAYEDPWADDNLSEGSTESSDAEQSESSADNSDENDEERAAIRLARQEVVQKQQAQKVKRETARQTLMLAWEPVLSKEQQRRVNERTLIDCQHAACLSDLADKGLTANRVLWLRTISVHQRVRGYRQKNQRVKRTTKRPTGPRTQKPQSEIDLIKAEVTTLFAVCKNQIPSALAMAKLRVGDDLEGETALLVPGTVPFSEDKLDNVETDARGREEDGIVQDFISL